MARYRMRFQDNVPGEFFVESACIDCDLCRQLAPEVFGTRASGQSVVQHQPVTDAERRQAFKALVTCPVSAIGTAGKAQKAELDEAISAFPQLIDGDVFECGFASADSFGAQSYLIRRAGGNVLVDSPRAAAPLLRRIEALGGVAMMFLSHRDDVADHARFHERFGARRVIHEADAVGELREVEELLSGDAPTRLAEDLVAIPLPGHTRGSAALLYRNRYLFTGDHLWWNEASRRLEMGREVCWYSWPQQVRSLRRLLDYDFEWVLPGHGRRFYGGSPEATRRQIERLLREL